MIVAGLRPARASQIRNTSASFAFMICRQLLATARIARM
jgi:hypothetical protein